MKLLSINVGQPREVEWQGRVVETSIFKSPVGGPVQVRRLNIDGDRQADLTVHGGVSKAVYAYPSEHYAPWREELGVDELPWGSFGENLTISGLLEPEVRIGDRLRIGSAEFVVTKPRTPCFKLALRFDRLDMIKRMVRNGRSGFYLSVEQEGEIVAGDDVVVVSRATGGATVAEEFASRY